MNSIARPLTATSIMALVLTCPQESYGEEFTGDTFLGWSDEAQASFLQTSISMATAIAAGIRPEIAQCLNEWYFSDDVSRSMRHDKIRNVVREFPQYNPTTVVLAVLEQQCGVFGGR